MDAKMNTLKDVEPTEYDIGNNKKITVPDLLDHIYPKIQSTAKKRALIGTYKDDPEMPISELLDYLKTNSLLQYLPDDIKGLLSQEDWRAKGAALEKAFKEAGYL